MVGGSTNRPPLPAGRLLLRLGALCFTVGTVHLYHWLSNFYVLHFSVLQWLHAQSMALDKHGGSFPPYVNPLTRKARSGGASCGVRTTGRATLSSGREGTPPPPLVRSGSRWTPGRAAVS